MSRQAWLIGYLAGLAVATETDIPPRISNAALYAWMDRYCNETPQTMVSNGKRHLRDYGAGRDHHGKSGAQSNDADLPP